MVQMGGVLRYKWDSGRCVAAFLFLQGLEASKAQCYKWGAYCGTNWRCTASTFQTSCKGWGFMNSAQRAAGVLQPAMTGKLAIRRREVKGQMNRGDRTESL